jgi:hypothetical protein
MLHTITINDTQSVINDKLAQQEQQAILNDFEKDFGFSLKDLPSLDLPLHQYEQALIEQAFLEAMSNEAPHWDCETDAYTRFEN